MEKNAVCDSNRPFWIYFAVLCAASFILNWCWEMAQMRGYTELARVPWWDTVLPCSRATGGDVIITLAVYAIGALASRQIGWAITNRWNVYATAAILGAACAVAIEWRAQFAGQWSYNEFMPVVPGLQVGLWPFLQLTVLIPAAFWLAWRVCRK